MKLFPHTIGALQAVGGLILSVVFLQPAPLVAQQAMYVGGDISVLQSYEDNNVAYYDPQGGAIADVVKYLKSEPVGWNAARVRLFVDPKQLNPGGQRDAQVCQNLDYVVRFCRRLKSEGYAIMLDFHYSDTWADPSNQWIPSAWSSLSDAQLGQRLYDYTKTCLERLAAEGAAPQFIQIGNEVSYGMLWSATVNTSSRTNRCFYDSPSANWERFASLLAQASRACREACPAAQVIIHTERAGDADALKLIYTKLADVDYDIIGLSYYPFWHNSLQVLGRSIDMLATSFPTKTVQVVETAYYYQWQPAGVTHDFSSTWPITPEGQAAFARDLVAELRKHSNVNGLYWWFPEENGNGPGSAVLTNWVNRGLWDNTTHRALPALYVLKAFTDGATDIRSVDGQTAGTTTATGEATATFDMLGRRLPASSSPRGTMLIEQRGTSARKIIRH